MNYVGGDFIKELVRKAKKGDKDAFVKLIDTCRSKLYNTAITITKNEQDALDALSETVLSAWENIPLIKNEAYFKTWLTKILINKCYDILRIHNKYSFTDIDVSGLSLEEDFDTAIDVKSKMESLNQNEKLIITLFYFDGFNISEIAEILDISKAAVKTRLSRSRQHFKEIYNKDKMETEVVYEK